MNAATYLNMNPLNFMNTTIPKLNIILPAIVCERVYVYVSAAVTNMARLL